MTAQRPTRGTPNYRRCEFTVGYRRCARQACWEVGWTYLCWKHVRMIRSLSRFRLDAPAIRIAKPRRT